MQTFTPQACTLHLSGMIYAQFPATIHKIEQRAGAEAGSATVSWPQKYASAQSTRFGDRAFITIGGEVVFRGNVAATPIVVAPDDDQVSLDLVDDKWLMSRNMIGQYGIGTLSADAGFTDVGYEVIFNRDGRPDKNSSSLDFNLGSAAVYWSLKNMLEFIFARYIDSDVATLNLSRLGSAYDAKPTQVNLIGQTALQAVDAIAELAGESWGLIPTRSASEFAPIRPGGWGKRRTVSLFQPNGGGSVVVAGNYHAASIDVQQGIQNARDRRQVLAGPTIKERGHANYGANPLLVRDTAFTHLEYATRFKVDVSQYQANGLGRNLSAGAKPKPWLSRLVTRMNDSATGYFTAAGMASVPARVETAERAEIPVWVSADQNTANAQLVTAGKMIDTENGMLYFKGQLTTIDPDNPDAKNQLIIEDWSAAGVWMTVATVLETFDKATSESSTEYLPKPFCTMTRKSELQQEVRELIWLPNPTTGAHTAFAPTEEIYVDIQPRLAEILAAQQALAPGIETQMDLQFDFIPIFNLGDLIALSGRDLGQTGNEVVTSVSYDVHEDYRTHVSATNIAAGAGSGSRPSRRLLDSTNPLGRIKFLDLAKLAPGFAKRRAAL